MRRADLLEKTLMLGKIERQKEKWEAEDEMVRQHQRLTDMNFSKLWEIVEDRGSRLAAVHESQRVGPDLETQQQQQIDGGMTQTKLYQQNHAEEAAFVKY